MSKQPIPAKPKKPGRICTNRYECPKCNEVRNPNPRSRCPECGTKLVVQSSKEW